MNTSEAKCEPGIPIGQFLDPRSCHELLGDLPHGRIGSLPISLLYFQLEAFLRRACKSYAPEVGTIPTQLLDHNLKADRSKETSEMLSIDADIVFGYNAQQKKTNIEFKAYFQNPEFERPIEHQRVILHVQVEEPDGLKRSVSVPLQPLMVGWGDVAEGHQGYSHSISFFDEGGHHLEQWLCVPKTISEFIER
jgi:hypothetical protein